MDKFPKTITDQWRIEKVALAKTREDWEALIEDVISTQDDKETLHIRMDIVREELLLRLSLVVSYGDLKFIQSLGGIVAKLNFYNDMRWYA